MLRFLVIFLLLFSLFFIGIRKIANFFMPQKKKFTVHKRPYRDNRTNSDAIDLVRDEKTGEYHIKKD